MSPWNFTPKPDIRTPMAADIGINMPSPIITHWTWINSTQESDYSRNKCQFYLIFTFALGTYNSVVYFTQWHFISDEWGTSFALICFKFVEKQTTRWNNLFHCFTSQKERERERDYESFREQHTSTPVPSLWMCGRGFTFKKIWKDYNN